MRGTCVFLRMEYRSTWFGLADSDTSVDTIWLVKYNKRGGGGGGGNVKTDADWASPAKEGERGTAGGGRNGK